MPSTALKVVVIRGSRPGEEFVLTKRLTRLGSDAGCEIQITGEGIPPHALSIDAQGDETVVYNRAEISLTVSGKSIEPLGSGVWKLGKDLLLPGSVQLRLEAYAAPVAVASKPLEMEDESDLAQSTNAQATANTSGKKSSTNASALLMTRHSFCSSSA